MKAFKIVFKVLNIILTPVKKVSLFSESFETGVITHFFV